MKEKSKTKFGRISIEMLRSITAFAYSAMNIAVTESIGGWSELMKRQRDNLTAIDNLLSIKTQPITGPAQQKKQFKDVVIELSYATMSAVRSFAIKKGLTDLAAAMNITRGDMQRMSYELFVPKIQDAIATVQPLVAAGDLAEWNITAATMTLWSNQTNTLAGILSSPKNNKAYIKMINENIQELLRQSMFLFHNEMDRAASNFITAGQTNYYNEYLANRKLYPNGHVPTQLRATTVNDVGMPVVSHIAIDGTTIEGDTDSKGYLLLSNIPFGYHKVNITVDGKTTTTAPIRFKKGQSLTMTFNVEKGFVIPESTPAVAKVPVYK